MYGFPCLPNFQCNCKEVYHDKLANKTDLNTGYYSIQAGITTLPTRHTLFSPDSSGQAGTQNQVSGYPSLWV